MENCGKHVNDLFETLYQKEFSFANEALPYGIRLRSSTSNVSSVNFLNANAYYTTSNYGMRGGISPKMAIYDESTGVPAYGSFLAQIMQKPFVCGALYLQSATVGQVIEGISLTYYSADGHVKTRQMMPLVPPNQYQSTVSVVYYPFVVDGYTELVFNRMIKNTDLYIYMYPVSIVEQINQRTMQMGLKLDYAQPYLNIVEKAILEN